MTIIYLTTEHNVICQFFCGPLYYDDSHNMTVEAIDCFESITRNMVTVVRNGLTWHTHLAHPKNEILPNIFFTPTSKNQFSSQLKKFLYFPEKVTSFPPEENISYNYQKTKIFETKNFLYLHKKVRVLHFRCVLNTAWLFSMLAKPNMVFNNLISSLTKNISPSFFCELVLFFHILFFSILN